MTTPLLSEMIEKSDGPESVFGVSVDCLSFSPPSWLKEVGFLYKTDETGDFDQDLMDVVISYNIANVVVMVEIPHDTPVNNEKHFVQIAANANFSVSLLPPNDDANDQEWDAYSDRLAKFAEAYLTQRNMSKMIYPISSYFEYLMANKIYGSSSKTPDDTYISKTFFMEVPVDRVTPLKDRLSQAIFNLFGGEDGFDKFAKAIAHGIVNKTAENCSTVFKNKTQNGI